MPEYMFVATMVRLVPEYRMAQTEESPRQMPMGMPMSRKIKKDRKRTALIITSPPFRSCQDRTQ